MANKKYLIHWLLALCIGLLPAMNVSAMSVGDPADMPMECLDCGPVEMNHGSTCQDPGCSVISQSCQSHSAANYLPASTVFESGLTRYIGNPRRSVTVSLQDIADSIYRPPIA